MVFIKMIPRGQNPYFFAKGERFGKISIMVQDKFLYVFLNSKRTMNMIEYW